ncbi:hypothetical protein APR50_43935 [Variovorax paradoxus]|jgi:hypothetical protein|uniref:GDSL-type esterase/lipase family protein n=1 Tax=Variovorax paradoxus TaxID=34073 RepID=UPI0006E58FEC|nr:hypothetical protein APR50_43935 [Variovorax paradoxus]KPU96215.1 hypothetical protein APR52_15215 [Variovorax paradoxus]KPV13595.1 hypothetical protein APR49_02200 [Variovorax paradoxus]KPV23474.1 hypothetical protein APR51_07495 [Variovorax paradoxus]KPV36437.1 hypothetical protein APR48_00100 [Variovorax paradoxus]
MTRPSSLPTWRRAALACACALALSGCGRDAPGGRTAAAPVPPPRPDCSVTLEGDSIMFDGGAALLMRLRPAYAVVDNSVAGSTATLRATAFPRVRLTTRFVVLQRGINDAMRGWQIEYPLRTMVGLVQAEGRGVVLTGLTRQAPGHPIALRDAHDATMRRIAAETGALFADWGSVAADPADIQADGLHPRPPYTARLIARLVEVLDTAAPECAARGH